MSRRTDADQGRIGVLFVSSVSGLGGAELTLFELATHLDLGIFIPHLLVSEDGALPCKIREAGIPTFSGDFPFFSKRRPWRYLNAIRNILSLIRRNNVQIVHVNCDRAIPHSVLAARLSGSACVCFIHDMVRAWFRPSYVRYLNWADAIVADSHATAEKCTSAGMDPSKVRVIHECLETERFARTGSSDREQFRREFRLENHELAIGLIGQVLEWKGHEDFVRAGAIVASQVPGVHFFVVGDDSMAAHKDFLPRVRRLVREMGLDKHFVFTGFRSDIPRVMAGLDVIVVPSWEEPFGRVVAESLAARRPVVATRAGGIPEIVEDGRTGYMFAPRDYVGLSQCLLDLCRDSGLRAAMGARGPAAVAKFDVREVANKFQELYLDILRRRGKHMNPDIIGPLPVAQQ